MNKKIGNIFKGDKTIWMVFLFLCLISLIEVFSASSTLTYKSQNYMGPIIYHAGTILAGLLVAIVTLNVPCRYFKLMTLPLLIISLLTLIWVLVGGESINGANRVISILGFTFQPSEIAKGTMVLYTAQILSATQHDDGADKKAFKWILVALGIATCLIGIENLSTAALLCAVIFLMMFIGRVPMAQLGKLLGAAAILITVFLTLVMTLGSMEESTETETNMTEVAINTQDEKLAVNSQEEEVDKDAIKAGGVPPICHLAQPHHETHQQGRGGS